MRVRVPSDVNEAVLRRGRQGWDGKGMSGDLSTCRFSWLEEVDENKPFVESLTASRNPLPHGSSVSLVCQAAPPPGEHQLRLDWSPGLGADPRPPIALGVRDRPRLEFTWHRILTSNRSGYQEPIWWAERWKVSIKSTCCPLSLGTRVYEPKAAFTFHLCLHLTFGQATDKRAIASSRRETQSGRLVRVRWRGNNTTHGARCCGLTLSTTAWTARSSAASRTVEDDEQYDGFNWTFNVSISTDPFAEMP
ncbi:unnamed protein product [Protopolystoma xenopodis]|uniref:Uncharacterized protein n=1 Tax=Protopolystoma xenopodis TaxID=117903 RepID=A0A448WME2_9PLAT|nr:unnamed protein product [Protopolystoma xenopodis]